VWLVMFGVVALFTFATPGVSDTDFNDTESPLSVSFAVLPQARLGLPTPSESRVSAEFRNFEVAHFGISYGEQDRHRAPAADLQPLLCVFLI
jgi:hypothetical protein